MQLLRQRRLLRRRPVLSGWVTGAVVPASAAEAAPSPHANVLAHVGTATLTDPIWWMAGLLVLGGLSGWFLLMQRRAVARERDRLNQVRELELERLSAAQARQAKEAADMANRAKGEFLATMSHEIRTPLNGVIGSAELMMETELTAQQREYMTTVRTSAEALLAIVNDILDFSKIEEGKVVLEHTMFDLRQPVVDVLKIASTRTGDRDLELVLDFAPDLPSCVYGDPGRLRQVLLNLVSNAVKFTVKGHVIVRVSRLPEKCTATQAWLRFSVMDTGIGIPAETRVKLFEKFTQADASTTRRFGGTGLGLAISKRLVNLMGGEIGLESDPGQGSLFWFSLPVQVDDLPLPEVKPPLTRVLIVDDLPPAAESLAGLLRGLMVNCVTAYTLDEAFARLREAVVNEHAFELALVDQSVMAADGGSFLRRLRATPELGDLPLVLLATGGLKRDSGACPPEYAALINKPVLHADQVLEAVRELRHMVKAADKPGVAVRLSRQGLRVLVAEDNQVNRAVVGGMLKKLGCQVEFAENGAEAVAKNRLNPHDLIFMDCLMPEMDGWHATLEIRRLDSRTPIIATTANATADDRSRCLKVGMNDYLSKPLRMADMVRVMERWVE